MLDLPASFPVSSLFMVTFSFSLTEFCLIQSVLHITVRLIILNVNKLGLITCLPKYPPQLLWMASKSLYSLTPPSIFSLISYYPFHAFCGSVRLKESVALKHIFYFSPLVLLYICSASSLECHLTSHGCPLKLWRGQFWLYLWKALLRIWAVE